MPARRARSSPSRIEYPTHHSQHKPNSVTHPKPSVTPDQPVTPACVRPSKRPKRNHPNPRPLPQEKWGRGANKNHRTAPPSYPPNPLSAPERGNQTKASGPSFSPRKRLRGNHFHPGEVQRTIPVPPFHLGKGSGEINSTLEKAQRTIPVPPFHSGKGVRGIGQHNPTFFCFPFPINSGEGARG